MICGEDTNEEDAKSTFAGLDREIRSPPPPPTHTPGTAKNKSNSTRKAVGANSSGAAGQPRTSFGLLKLDGVPCRCCDVEVCNSLVPSPRPNESFGQPASHLPTDVLHLYCILECHHSTTQTHTHTHTLRAGKPVGTKRGAQRQ